MQGPAIINTSPAFKATVSYIVMLVTPSHLPKNCQALGPFGINMMQFCKEFNDRTGDYNGDVPMRVLLKAYADRSFKF